MKKMTFFVLSLIWLTSGISGGYVAPVLHAAPKADVKFDAQLQPVNLNKAGIEELQTLQGIGPSLAGRIIKFREENGRFEKIEDLTKVSGIGPSKFEKIKAHVTL